MFYRVPLSSDYVGVAVANFDNLLVVDYNCNVADSKIYERDMILESVDEGFASCVRGS